MRGEIGYTSSQSATPQVEGKTEMAVIYPLFAAFQAANNLISPSVALTWLTCNEEQRSFVDMFALFGQQTGAVSGIDARAAFSVEEINAWLRSLGSTIQLDPLPPILGSIPFAAAGVFDLLVDWHVPGTETTVTYKSNRYPAFKQRRGMAAFYEVPDHNHPVVCLHTKSGHRVFATILDRHPGGGFRLLDTAIDFARRKAPLRDHGFDGAVIPMVRAAQCADFGWMKNMWTKTASGSPAVMMQCLNETRLRMNHLGAHGEGYTAMSGQMLANERSPYVMDRPFLTWWEQNGIELPIFSAFVMETEWQDPGNLSKPYK